MAAIRWIAVLLSNFKITLRDKPNIVILISPYQCFVATIKHKNQFKKIPVTYDSLFYTAFEVSSHLEWYSMCES